MTYSNESAAHAILGVSQGASIADIKSAYRRLALQFHPDRLFGALKAEILAAQQYFAVLADAYNTLREQANNPTPTVPDFVPAEWANHIGSGSTFAPATFPALTH